MVKLFLIRIKTPCTVRKSRNEPLGFYQKSQSILRLQECVIQQWNGNLWAFRKYFQKLCQMFLCSVICIYLASGIIGPTQIWNLTSNFEAIWGHNPILTETWLYMSLWIYFLHHLPSLPSIVIISIQVS